MVRKAKKATKKSSSKRKAKATAKTPPKRRKSPRSPTAQKKSQRETEIEFLFDKLKPRKKSERETTVRRFADIEYVRAVPSLLTSYNRASQCGGAPLGGINVVTGPFSGGKSILTYTAGVLSFDAAGHISAFLNAEQRGDRSWWEKVAMSSELRYPSSHLYGTPGTFSELCFETTRIINGFLEGKAKGVIHETRALSVVIDSLDQALPLEKFRTFFSGKDLSDDDIKQLRDTDRFKAMLNKWLLAGLVSMIRDNDVVVWIVAHEREVEEKHGRKTWKARFPKGGGELEYRAQQELRAWYQPSIGQIREGSGGYDGKGLLVGKFHEFEAKKNKVGYAHEKGRIPLTFGIDGYKLVQEGAGNPRGLDVARELVFEARHREMLVIDSKKGVGEVVSCDLFGYDEAPIRRVLCDLRMDRDKMDELRKTLDRTAIANG